MTARRVAHVVAALDAQGLLVSTQGTLPESIAGLADDSRKIVPGGLFIAVRGVDRDGHDYLDQARERGAAAAIVEDSSRTRLPALVVRDSRRAAAHAAAAYFGDPARSLRMVGVTGTNGKTTTVGILRHLLDAPGNPSASIGTLGVLRHGAGETVPGGSGLTTPGPVELQLLLRMLVDDGVRAVAMEISSHSLDQHRVDGILLDAAVFTNLSRDHLDYHATMERYLASKLRMVELLKPVGIAVINADDPAWSALPERVRRITFGMQGRADVQATDVKYAPGGSEWTLAAGGERHAVALPLIGDFNVANALAAAAAALAIGSAPRTIASRLSHTPQVAGRLEMIHEHPRVLRDYAHTPDALERALRAVRPFTTDRLILVFGCGGDRDPGKRPLMGEIGARLADRTIVTSDNPRTEDPETIIDQIVAAMPAGSYERIEDRRAAIARALDLARDGDLVLLAGKGHEDYQVRGTTKFPFDERLIVRELTGGPPQ